MWQSNSSEPQWPGMAGVLLFPFAVISSLIIAVLVATLVNRGILRLIVLVLVLVLVLSVIISLGIFAPGALPTFLFIVIMFIVFSAIMSPIFKNHRRKIALLKKANRRMPNLLFRLQNNTDDEATG